jgi:hypothetical protein
MNSKLFDRRWRARLALLGIANISTACGEYAMTLITTQYGAEDALTITFMFGAQSQVSLSHPDATSHSHLPDDRNLKNIGNEKAMMRIFPRVHSSYFVSRSGPSPKESK